MAGGIGVEGEEEESRRLKIQLGHILNLSVDPRGRLLNKTNIQEKGNFSHPFDCDRPLARARHKQRRRPPPATDIHHPAHHRPPTFAIVRRFR
jgi:hypothetical protein